MRADDMMPKDFLVQNFLPVVEESAPVLSPEIELGISQICAEEGMSREEAEGFFRHLMAFTERRIMSAPKISNHLTVLNRQLRQAAAVFLLVVAGSMLMSCAGAPESSANENNPSGPYELALGSKVVP